MAKTHYIYKPRVVVTGGCRCKNCIQGTILHNASMGNYKVAECAMNIIGAIHNDPIDRVEEARQHIKQAEIQEKKSELWFNKCSTNKEKSCIEQSESHSQPALSLSDVPTHNEAR